MEIKITIPDEIKEKVCDSFIHGNKEKFEELNVSKDEFLKQFLHDFVKTVYNDYVSNIEVVDQIKELKANIKTNSKSDQITCV